MGSGNGSGSTEDSQQDGGVGFCTYLMWHMTPNKMEELGFVHTLCGTCTQQAGSMGFCTYLMWHMHPTGWRREVLYIPYVAHAPNRMEAWGFVHTLCGT